MLFAIVPFMPLESFLHRKVNLLMQFLVFLLFFCITLFFTVSCEDGFSLDKSPEAEKVEPYIVPYGGIEGHGKAQGFNLHTVKSWKGTTQKEIIYNATKAPWVINAGHTPTSVLGSQFEVNVWKPTEMHGIRVGALDSMGRWGTFDGRKCFAIEETGKFIIEIQASGCEWWLKIGIE